MALPKDHSFWEIISGKRNCCVVNNDWDLIQTNKPKELALEFTLSLVKDDKEYLENIYKKILKGIDSIYRITDHIAFYELGGVKQHRHIHAKFTVKLPTSDGSIPGLIEEIARKVCQIIRRQYNDKNMLHALSRYQSVPFVLQVNTRESWDNYIRKNAPADFDKIIF